jgi:uncharacterized damage-inducible protein DinB
MTIRRSILTALLCLLTTAPLAAQTREGVMADLLADVAQVEKKMLALARAMPDSAYAWRPGDGVRSTAETFLHVAADNYFIPALMGVTIPSEVGIKGDDFKTTVTFEKRTLTREQVVAELEKSFQHLRSAMTATPEASLAEPLQFFGQKSTRRGLWITATTHLHEHLGQLIAYARSNKVTPPWSK